MANVTRRFLIQSIQFSWKFNNHQASTILVKQQTTIYTTIMANYEMRHFSTKLDAPIVRRHKHLKTVHGKEIIDHYAWLKEIKNKEVLQYLADEDRYSSSVLSDTKELQEDFIIETMGYDATPTKQSPQEIDGYVYYDKIVGDMPVHCRCKQGSNVDEEEVVIDLNLLAAAYGQSAINVTSMKISPSQQLVAVVIETSNSDVYNAQVWRIGKPSHIKILEQSHEHGAGCSHHGSGHHGDGNEDSTTHTHHGDKMKGNINEQLDVIHNVFNIEWGEGDVLFYTSSHEYRASEVWRHEVGNKKSQDVLIFEESDERFFVDISHTKDKKYLPIYSTSKSSSEVHLIDASKPTDPPILVQPKQDGLEYFVEHSNGIFYILTNMDAAQDYKLMKVDSNGDLTKEQWQDVYVAGEHTKIIDMDVFDNHCVLLMKHKGIPGVTVIPLQCPSEHKSIQLPVTSCVLLPNDNPDFYSTMYDFTLASPILPAVKYKVDMKSNVINNTDGESEFWLDKDEHYTCQRIDAISKDGCEIGMTVFYQSNLPLDGNNPMLVYGYGAYGEDMNLNYKPQQMILLNRGWIIVFTHVRGGGEMGRQWYREGRLNKKHKSFEDVEACLKHLHDAGYSCAGKTAVCGTSAGGLLMATVCNRSPHLIKAAVLKVPFVDVLNTMLDPMQPLTSQEYEEFGNPLDDRNILDYIDSYCPYQNITDQEYPSMLLTASMNDTRVPYWMPLKYTAKRRHYLNQTNSNKQDTLLLQVTGNGHFDDDDLYEQTALEFGFLYKALGLPFV